VIVKNKNKSLFVYGNTDKGMMFNHCFTPQWQESHRPVL